MCSKYSSDMEHIQSCLTELYGSAPDPRAHRMETRAARWVASQLVRPEVRAAIDAVAQELWSQQGRSLRYGEVRAIVKPFGIL